MRRIFLIGIVLLFFIGCSNSDSEISELKDTIKRYNELLIRGYRTMDMNIMREVATEWQAETLYIHMAAMAEGDSRLEARLKKLEFVDINFESASKAVVRTREVWDYAHYSIKTGAKTLEEKDFIYELGYHLEKQKDGRWLVARVVAIKTSDAKEDRPLKEPPRQFRKGRAVKIN